MMTIGYGQSASAPPPAATPALAAAPVVTSTSTGTSRAISVPATTTGQRVVVGVAHSAGTAVVTAPNADWELLGLVKGGTPGVTFFGYIGLDANRPNNTTVTFTTDVSSNTGGIALVFDGGGFGARGTTTTALDSTPNGVIEANLTGTKTANSLWMHLYSETGSSSITGFTAPATGFGSGPPGAYPATQGQLYGNGTDFSFVNSSIYLQWGSYGSGAFVPSAATASGAINVAMISFEILP